MAWSGSVIQRRSRGLDQSLFDFVHSIDVKMIGAQVCNDKLPVCGIRGPRMRVRALLAVQKGTASCVLHAITARIQNAPIAHGKECDASPCIVRHREPSTSPVQGQMAR